MEEVLNNKIIDNPEYRNQLSIKISEYFDRLSLSKFDTREIEFWNIITSEIKPELGDIYYTIENLKSEARILTQEKTKSKEKSSQNYKTHATEITITEDKTNRKLNQHPKTLLTKTNLKIDRSPPRDKAREKINKDFKSSEAGKRTEPMIEKKPIISRSPMNVKAVKKIETPQLLKKEIPTKKKIEASPQRKLNGVKLFNSSDKKSQKPKGELKSIEIDITSKRKKGKDNLLETNERIIPVCKFTTKDNGGESIETEIQKEINIDVIKIEDIKPEADNHVIESETNEEQASTKIEIIATNL